MPNNECIDRRHKRYRTCVSYTPPHRKFGVFEVEKSKKTFRCIVPKTNLGLIFSMATSTKLLKDTDSFINKLKCEFGNFYLIPEHKNYLLIQFS